MILMEEYYLKLIGEFFSNKLDGLGEYKCITFDSNLPKLIDQIYEKKISSLFGILMISVDQHQNLKRFHKTSVIYKTLGIQRIMVAVEGMERCEYSETKFEEIKSQIQKTLTKSGWEKNFVERSVPIIPFSNPDNQNIEKCGNRMEWWDGVEIEQSHQQNKKIISINSIFDGLQNHFQIVDRTNLPFRSTVSSCYLFSGVDVVVNCKKKFFFLY